MTKTNMTDIRLIFLLSLYYLSLFAVIYYGVDFQARGLTQLTLLLGMILLLSLIAYEKFYVLQSSKSGYLLSMVLALSLAFLSFDFFSFYVFFELSMVPILLYILSWGTDLEKWESSFLMFMFTYFGSVFYLCSLFFSYNMEGTMSFSHLELYSAQDYSMVWSFGFLLVFLFKLPVFFFHVWLPLAHVESPLMGSMILAGIMLKLGGFGFLKFFDCYYSSLLQVKTLLMVLGIMGGIYAAMECMFQFDYKRVVALSSVSHMSLVMAGISSCSGLGKWGSFSLMMSHGVSSSAYFYSLGIFYYRFHTRSSLILRGMVSIMPLVGLFWFILFIYNLAFPPLLPFMAELSIFWSMISSSLFYMSMIFVMIMAGSIYTVFLYTQLFSNKSVKLSSGEPLSLSEHLLIFIHLYIMIFMTLLVWFW